MITLQVVTTVRDLQRPGSCTVSITGQDVHTFLLSLLARALAIMVLPVPGGP